MHTMTDFVTGDIIALWTFTRRWRIQIACHKLNATTSSFKDEFVICAIKKLRQKHAHIELMTWNWRCPRISFYFSASRQLCCLFRVRWPTFQTWCKSIVTQRHGEVYAVPVWILYERQHCVTRVPACSLWHGKKWFSPDRECQRNTHHANGGQIVSRTGLV